MERVFDKKQAFLEGPQNMAQNLARNMAPKYGPNYGPKIWPQNMTTDLLFCTDSCRFLATQLTWNTVTRAQNKSSKLARDV